MPKTEVTITEIAEFEPTRVDGVGKGANGFPILMLKAIGDEKITETETTLDEVLTEMDKAEVAKCETCDGSGKIMEGHRECPDCKGSGKASEATKAESFKCETCRDTGKAFGKVCPDCEGKAADEATKAESFKCETCRDTGKAFGKTCPDCEGKSADEGEATKEAGVAPSGSGPTPAKHCPTCKGDGIIRDNTKSGKPCVDCGGTGMDEARTNAVELNAVDAPTGKITVGDAAGRERIDKADGSFAGANPSNMVAASDADVNKPGSPAWEMIDAQTATQAAMALMAAAELIRKFADREQQEVAAGMGSDMFDAGAATAALQGVSQALGIMAQLAFHEGVEAQKGTVEKAGRRLASRAVSALATARDHLNEILGDDDPAKQTEDEQDGGESAASKFIETANKAMNGKDVLDMTADELQALVVATVAEAVVTADAVKAEAKKGKDKYKSDDKMSDDKMSDDEMSDDDDDEDDDEDKAEKAKAPLTEAELEAQAAAKAARKEYKAAKKAAKQAADQATLTKSIEDALAKVAQENDVLKATVESLTENLEAVKKMAAPSDIVRIRPQDALNKSAERDVLDLEISKYENLAKTTQEPELRRGYNDRIKSLRAQMAAL